VKQNTDDNSIKILNNFPVNQKAKEFLDMIGETVSPHVPYSVQLVLWAIQKNHIVIEDILLETIQAMPTWSSARLSNFFIFYEKREEEYVDKIQAIDNPLDLVSIILDDIERRIMNYFPWYGSCLET